MSRNGPGQVHRITTAPESLADDQARRARRYLVQMGIRVVCFVLAVVLWNRVPMWIAVLLAVGAVVLPYVAVLFANAGRERTGTMDVAGPPELGPGGPTYTLESDPAEVRPADAAPTDGGPR
ncbi:DUF3099 domain-containing protein [Cellulomonas hominis]